MEEIADIATNLQQNDEGLWVARDQRVVSYPDEGNESCFAVEDSSFWFNHRNNVIATLAKAFPPSGPVFDVGGGNGYVALALQRNGIDAIVVEPGSGAQNAMKRGLKVVIQSSLEDAGFKHDSISAFGLFDVLEHIEDDSGFLETLHRCLKPQGRLYLTVPAFSTLWSFHDEHAGHFRRYSKRSLQTTLTSAGFTVMYFTYFFWFLVPTVFLYRSIPSRLRIRRSISEATRKREHATPNGRFGSILDRCLALEIKRIEKGKKMLTGSSCIAVAQKMA